MLSLLALLLTAVLEELGVELIAELSEALSRELKGTLALCAWLLSSDALDRLLLGDNKLLVALPSLLLVALLRLLVRGGCSLFPPPPPPQAPSRLANNTQVITG